MGGLSGPAPGTCDSPAQLGRPVGAAETGDVAVRADHEAADEHASVSRLVEHLVNPVFGNFLVGHRVQAYRPDQDDTGPSRVDEPAQAPG